MTPPTALDELLLDVHERRHVTPEFAEALTAASLWLPVGEVVDDSPRLMQVTLDGAPYLPAFSSESALRSVLAEAPAVVQPFSAIAELLPAGTGLVINPNLEGTVPLPWDAVQGIAGSADIPAGATVRLGEPAEEPTAALEVVSGVLSTLPEVLEARRCLAMVGSGAPRVIIGIGLADSDTEQNRDRIAGLVMDALVGSGVDALIDLMFLDERNEISDWLMQNVEPFYRR